MFRAVCQIQALAACYSIHSGIGLTQHDSIDLDRLMLDTTQTVAINSNYNSNYNFNN